MANKKVSSVNFLPEYFKTVKNKKFLNSTIDQLIQKPQLESIDGYIGSERTPTYKASDVYISNGNPYQLDPALIIRDKLGNVVDTQGYDDFVNEVAIKGGSTNNLDRLLRTTYYSYNAHVDWDKLVNYQNYFWMPFGPEVLEVPTSALDIDFDIVGKATATVEVLTASGEIETLDLSNGMLLSFGGLEIDQKYHNRYFFVEGVGMAIKLIPYDDLIISESYLSPYPDGFDSNKFDDIPYDNDRELPNLKVEYVTINRASADLNPWSRYNRWVHKDVLKVSAMINGVSPDLATGRAQRPIIEFKADIKLFNFGSQSIVPVDLMDTRNTDPFSTIEGSTDPVYIDGVLVENGHRVIFNATELPGIRGKVYEVVYIIQQGVPTLTLQPTYEPEAEDSVTILLGKDNNATEWWFNGEVWIYAQQKENLNQAPLFDLFDKEGNSYSDKNFYLSNFTGNKIFSYATGNNPVDPYLGFSIAYRNVNSIGGILFDNNLCSETVVISQLGEPTREISSNAAYIKINNEFKNAWTKGEEYPIPLLSSTATGILSYYEEPLSLTNNPLNGNSPQFTISELGQHVSSMVEKLVTIPGLGLRDLPDVTSFGTTLIASENPIAFAQMFLGQKEHDVVIALQKSAENYGNFKLAFLNKLLSVTEQVSPVEAVDQILTSLSESKVYENEYYLSDMAGFGVPEITRSWTVNTLTINNPAFPLQEDFDLNKLNLRAVYVYRNGEQLVYGVDYTFNTDTTTVDIHSTLEVGDVIVINDYKDTTANYIPLTPTKLGLYPKFAPEIFDDTSYTTPQRVIQGHDGSITIAYGDYRDAIILELEKRIYNNIKSNYNSDLIDINSVIPGAFKNTDYSMQEVSQVLEGDFVRWTTRFGIDYVSNTTFDTSNSKTWNLTETSIEALDQVFSGSYKALLVWLYGTDRPHSHPWEMLGLYQKPTWWDASYGPAPYSSGNLILWNDIAEGRINGTVNPLYVRTGLLDVLPVNEEGDLIAPVTIVAEVTESNKRKSWTVGDLGPAEHAWRRSSYYPFAVQRLLALTKPTEYLTHFYDLSRVEKNISGQWIYTNNNSFFTLKDLAIYGENNTLTSGFSAFISEIGKARDKNYITKLRQDLSYATYRLFSKLNGYADKDTLRIVIDAFDPTSAAPGSILPSQNYQLWFNTSNPLASLAISGIIVQKVENGYSIRGYDKQDAFFNVLKPIRNLGTASINIGGVSEKYVVWQPSGTGIATGLSAADTTSASAAPTGSFYQKGQYVEYNGAYYRTIVAHRASGTFNQEYFQRVGKIPTKGGASVQVATTFEQDITRIPYGAFYSNIQEVYDLIIGYGRWLESQGFRFDDFSEELNKTLNWDLTAEEFLFWSTQNWDVGSIITLSPFADSLTHVSDQAVVNNLFDSFYEYSILGADGTAYPKEDISVSRTDGTCLIETGPNTDGIYFARLNLVQKEHAIVFDNSTIFGDVIYDIETGNRQRRVKLVGFKTANWDGGLTSPGFVYDKGESRDWAPNVPYIIGDAVRFNGNYYSANQNVERSSTFEFAKWDALREKPVPALLPNFDYRIGQFEDFYSLDSDNFDEAQQTLAQHLTGYTPRVYLNNIFPDPIAQYKFYQGFIREKGTKNAVSKLAKVSELTNKGALDYKEEWAFRVGSFGSFRTYNELETPLVEGTFLENPQIFSFVSEVPPQNSKDLIHYVTPADLTVSPDSYNPETTFKSTTSTDALLLQHSGYVRLGDVTATAYNENSLLDIANSGQLKDGDTVWLGFKSDGDWDVYRYSYVPAEVVGVFVSSPLSAITFTTKYAHGLSVGQIIGINQLNDQVNGIYKVIAINNLKQFTVASELASIENAPLPTPGQLYVFKSVRTTSFDNLPSDETLFRAEYGSKYWIDNTEAEGWEVYEKVDNYTSNNYSSLFAGIKLGKAISRPKGSNIIVAGAPLGFFGSGAVIFYEKQPGSESYSPLLRWRLGGPYTQPGAEFGSSVFYDDKPFSDSKYGLVFAGAPTVGVVKISSINSEYLIEGKVAYIENPDPGTVTGFGKYLFVQRNADTKLVLIGANTAVYYYEVKEVAGEISAVLKFKVTTANAITGISGSDNGSTILVGTGNTVEVYNQSLIKVQTLQASNTHVRISSDGTYAFVSNALANNTNDSLGTVSVYKNLNGSFVVDQVITNPVAGSVMEFGTSVDVDQDTQTLVVSATGVNTTLATTFDKGLFSLDNGITTIKSTKAGSGAVYVYYRKTNRFVFTQELLSDFALKNPGTNYGRVVLIDGSSVFVGIPCEDNVALKPAFVEFTKIDESINSLKLAVKQDTFVDVGPLNRIALIDTNKDQVINYLDIYDPLKGRIPGIAEQELSYKLMSDPAIYSIGLQGVNVDTNKNWLDEHVGELWWDLSTAKYQWYEQGDLEYRKNNWGKLFPGATIDVYEWVSSSLLPSEWAIEADTAAGLAKGISGQPRFVDNSVISVKQVYDPVTNSFTNVYYYWVKNKTVKPTKKNRRLSSYDVATAIADPKAYGLSFAAVIDSHAIMLSNLGSVPVENTVSINIAQSSSTEIVQTPRHTQWYILEEGSNTKMPPSQLEKKMIDSLLGRDQLGNLVPDPDLSLRTRYGIGVRPQQTMFADRHTALRNIIEFANEILISQPVNGYYSFKNLNAQEEIPDQYGNTYDFLVEDNVTLESIDTTGFERAVLNCSINNNGEVDNIVIANAGSGYGKLNPVYSSTGTVIGYEGPTFTVDDARYITTFDNNVTTFDGNRTRFVTRDEPNIFAEGLKITTRVDETGSIVQATIVNAGKRFGANFRLVARPHTVVVQSDDTYNGKWTQYEWDYVLGLWARAHTQSYNTSLYWDYVDYASSDYNQFQIYSSVVGSPYELDGLVLQPNQYVKINNGGDGNFVVLKKTDVGVYGTYGDGYDLVYKQNGTIQFKDSLWRIKDNPLNWDYKNTWDQTLWDQTPDIELEYIFAALKKDLFIYELKSNWNLLFFKAVKYAMSEQKILDWAFKTSFISLTHTLGELDQPPVYKMQDSSYYEDYVKEVKPYHTQIRNFITKYTITEINQESATPAPPPPPTPSIVYFKVTDGVGRNDFVIKLTDPVKIQNARDQLNGVVPKLHITGLIIKSTVDYNPNYSYHYDPDTIDFFELAMEVCDATFDYTEEYLDEAGGAFLPGLRLCPWSSELLEEVSLTPAPMVMASSFSMDQGVMSFSNSDVSELERTTSIELKFDRTSFANQVGDFEVLDTFVADGIARTFDLSWVPAFDKTGIVVKVNGIIALGSEWNVDYTERLYNGFHKKFAALNILEQEPLPAGTVITVKYKKNASILNGTERVLAYYTSTYGVVGLDLNALVEGIDYPGLTVGGSYEGPGFSNAYGGLTPDTYLSGGTWLNGEKNTALGLNPEDIIITGEVGFINTFSGHAPAEMLPGFVVDALGVNVYTVGPSLSPTIINGNFVVEPGTEVQRYSLPMLPVSIDSVSVVLNSDILQYTTSTLVLGEFEFGIDWVTQELLIPPQPTSGELDYSLIGVGGGTSNFGVIDHTVLVVNSSTSATIQSTVLASIVQDAYVTVNGIYTVDTVLDTSAGATGFANITVSNLNELGVSAIQAWFFTESSSNFNQIVEQVSTTSTFSLNSTGTHVFELLQNGRVERLTNSQYVITGTTVVIDAGIMQLGDSVRVVTFIDNTGSLGVVEEEFVGDPSRRFIMSQPVSNVNYMWVSIIGPDGNTKTLTNGEDFIILEDNLTIQISDSWNINITDIIEVISFKDPMYSGNVLGYRMFRDILGNTTYTRISEENSTYLTEPLSPTDTEIYVHDASVLTTPIVDENKPGVILINYERIEFYQVDGNVLKQITRGTLGTGINSELLSGVKVVDQGYEQEFDTSETTDVQVMYTDGSEFYEVKQFDHDVLVPNTTSTVNSQGITLNSNLPLDDQLEVYLGGRQLRKTRQYSHDTSVLLDTIPMSAIKGTVSQITDLNTITANAGDAYIDASTGKVWMFTRTRTEDITVPGWVFSGMTRLEPEFSVVIDGGTQKIYLNIEVDDDIELALVNKYSNSNDFNTVVSTGTTLPLWDSTTSIANFLKEARTVLPSDALVSNESVLTDERGQPLTNENGVTLTGNT
jgi:hypothetical protein